MMEGILLESAVRATLLAIAVAALVRILRINTAAGRHAAWTVVVAAMLLLPAWTMWGPRAPLPVLRERAVTVLAPALYDAELAAVAGSDAARGVSSPIAAAQGAPPAWRIPWRAVVPGTYVLGLLLMLARLTIGTVRTRRLIRHAVTSGGRWTSARCAAPVTVGWWRPVVILPIHWRSWPSNRLQMVLIHEHEHVRRRDPLVQWIALLNRAVFWFHPLAWWLERRLAQLADEACDAAVLSHGHHPADYSECLVSLARAVVRAGGRVQVIGSAMPGASLSRRIRRIVSAPPEPSPSRGRIAGIVILCAVMSGVTAAATVVPAQARAGQSSASSSGQRLPEYWFADDEWHLEVGSILAGAEMEAYRRVQTAGERDSFIDTFWRRRDPTPGTDLNEFRDEFERRVAFAKEHFKNPESAASFGYQTDRGRWHVRYGPPQSVLPGRLAMEEWQYASLPGLGSNVLVQFDPSSGVACTYRGGKYRIVSPAPVERFDGTVTGARPARRAYALTHPDGFVYLSFPIDPAAAAMRWGMRAASGAETVIGDGQDRPIDYIQGEIASVADRPRPGARSVLDHFSGMRLFERDSIACTEQLPRDTYTLTAETRLLDGTMRVDRVTFEVE